MKRASWLGIGSRACMVLAVTLAPQLDADGEAAILNEREGMRRVDGDRREDRQIAGEELLLSHARSAEVSSLGSTMWMPAAAISAFSALQQAC